MKNSHMSKLGDICSIRTGKLDSNAAVENGEYPFFTCAQETFRIDKFAFDTEAVLLGGNNANGIFPLKYYQGKFNAYQRTYIIESMDKEKVLNKFIYFSLRPVLAYFKSASIGATTQFLTKPILDNLKINLPEIHNQKYIVDLLFTYDNLIDNNRKRIQLLEESARLLFREWFVYFRFPGHEKGHPVRKSDSNGVKIIDGVPEGWEKRKLKEIANITMGQSPKSEFYNEDGNGLPFHQGVSNFSHRFPENKTYCTVNNRLAHEGDILFSVRAPVGRINITLEKIVIGRGLAALKSKTNHQNFLFYKLVSHFFKDDMIGGGAIFASITKKGLEDVELLHPSKDLINSFEVIVKPTDQQIRYLTIQNQKLAQARDLLLPRLMNGTIQV